MSPLFLRCSVVLLALGISAGTSHATERRFSYSYETTTAAKGSWEVEQWMTWKSYGDQDRFDFRHEIETGITDTLQLGFYLADWRYEDGVGSGGKADYQASGVELIQQLSDPNKSALGSALYAEVLVGDEKIELEGKLLLQKNFGPLVAVYNAVLEAEWEGESLSDLDEKTGVWENTLGVSYQVNPSVMVGAEALHEVEFADWGSAGEHVLYAGPNLSLRKGRLFGTLAGLFQASHVDGEPDTQLRVIAGFSL